MASVVGLKILWPRMGPVLPLGNSRTIEAVIGLEGIR